MTYRKEAITVRYRNGFEYLLPDAPVRILPDGSSGVVYQRFVYPLHSSGDSNDWIQLGGPKFAKEDCPHFVKLEEPLVYGTSDQSLTLLPAVWSIETNRYGHYFVWDGPEVVAENIVDTLESSGIGVLRWDASQRAAADGRTYDWFARLSIEGTPAKVKKTVAAALSASQSVEHPDTERMSNMLAILEARATALEAQVALVSRTQDAALAKVKKEQAKSHRLQRQVLELTRELTATQTGLLSAKDDARKARADLAHALRERAASASSEVQRLVDATSKERAQLLVAQERLTGEIVLAKADCAVFEEIANQEEVQRRELTSEVAELSAEVESLRLRLGEFETTPVPQMRSERARQRRENLWKRRVWKRLILHDDTLEAMMDRTQFPDPSHLMTVLVDLDRGTVGGMPFAGQPEVRGRKVIREVPKPQGHINTGENALGRVYFAEVDDEGERRVLVFAHRKTSATSQTAFVEAALQKWRKFAG